MPKLARGWPQEATRCFEHLLRALKRPSVLLEGSSHFSFPLYHAFVEDHCLSRPTPPRDMGWVPTHLPCRREVASIPLPVLSRRKWKAIIPPVPKKGLKCGTAITTPFFFAGKNSLSKGQKCRGGTPPQIRAYLSGSSYSMEGTPCGLGDLLKALPGIIFQQK